MRTSRSAAVWLLGSLIAACPAWGQSHHAHYHQHHHGGGSGGYTSAAYLSGAFSYWPPLFAGIGSGGPFTIAPAWLILPPVGVAGPWPPPQFVPSVPPAASPARPRRDPTKAGQLTTIGDRLFRAGNTKRAAERYDQAARTDPDSAGPRIRLAQVAFVRGRYADAADYLRAALLADPGWLSKAPDIQSIYAEPADFARQIARLESHLQASPADRDGWLVLGAQWFLSGRTTRASDVFLRLSDRKPDAALAAFLDAVRPAEPVR